MPEVSTLSSVPCLIWDLSIRQLFVKVLFNMISVLPKNRKDVISTVSKFATFFVPLHLRKRLLLFFKIPVQIMKCSHD